MSHKTRDVTTRTVPCEIVLVRSRPEVPIRVTATEGSQENDFPVPRRRLSTALSNIKTGRQGRWPVW